jgi:hypothetical protein
MTMSENPMWKTAFLICLGVPPGALLAGCSAGPVPLGSENEAVNVGHKTGPGSGATGSSSGGSGSSCAPSKSLTGTFTIIGADPASAIAGDPDAGVLLSNQATISISSDTGVPAVEVLSPISINGLDEGNALLSIQELSIGVQPFGNVGTSDGEFNADRTAFTFTDNAIFNSNCPAGCGAGFATAASLTEPSACEVQLVVTYIPSDFVCNGPTTPADTQTITYLFRRQ